MKNVYLNTEVKFFSKYFFYFAGLLCVLFLNLVILHERSYMWLSFILLQLVVFFSIKLYKHQGIFSWIIFVLIGFCVFTILPLYYVLLSNDLSNTYIETSDLFADEAEKIIYLANATFINAIALTCVLIGYSSSLAKKIGYRLPFFKNEWSNLKTFISVFSFSIIGALGYIKFVSEIGGINFLLLNLVSKWDLTFFLNKYFQLLALLWGIGSFIWLSHHYSVRKNYLSFLHLLIYLFIVMSLGLRGLIISALISVWIIKDSFNGKLINDRFFLISSLIIVIAIIIITTTLRAGDKNVSISYFEILNGNYGSINQMAVILKVMQEKIDLLMGKSFVDIFLMLIPRHLWSDKPVGLGYFLSDIIWPGCKGGFAPYAVTEFYVNFHIIGVIIGMICLGFLGRIMYSYFEANSSNRGVVLLYSVLLTSFGIGSISGFVIGELPKIIALFLVLYFVSGGLRKRRLELPISNRTPL